MNDEPKLELNWIQREGRREAEPCLKFQAFVKARGASISYGAAFRVCATPRCPCLSVCVHCAPLLPDGAASPGPLRWFWVDVWKRAVEMTAELKADPETLSLAEIIGASLTERAWEELHRWFWTAKIQVIEAADVAKIDLTNLPDAEDGLMIPFVKVFPLGLSLHCTFENGCWAADEQYCVHPGCDCAQAVLSFLKLKDATGRKITSLRNVPALRYNYRSQATQELAVGRAGLPTTEMLLVALKSAYPNLNRRLKLHHRIMQSLYTRHYLTQAKSQLQSALSAPLPATSEKVGRNDPCPCGSGKKFKKCCGT